MMHLILSVSNKVLKFPLGSLFVSNMEVRVMNKPTVGHELSCILG